MAKFYTADEHYGHRRILEFCKRPFADVYEMREKLIAAHNAKVGRGDLTYHLGDIFWRTMAVDEAQDIMNRLNGQHMLVWGNHDELIENNRELQARFANIQHIMHLQKTDFAPKIVLCHYAMRVWRNSHHGAYHLYGHSHAALPEANTLSFDCGVDSRPDYAPWSEAEVIAKMKNKQFAGAKDPMSAVIEAEPWNKAKGAEVAYPSNIEEKSLAMDPKSFVEKYVVPAFIPPQIPQEVWDAIKEADRTAEETSGSSLGRCIE